MQLVAKYLGEPTAVKTQHHRLRGTQLNAQPLHASTTTTIFSLLLLLQSWPSLQCDDEDDARTPEEVHTRNLVSRYCEQAGSKLERLVLPCRDKGEGEEMAGPTGQADGQESETGYDSYETGKAGQGARGARGGLVTKKNWLDSAVL